MLDEKMVAALNESLNWSRVKERPQGGRQVPYLEGHDVIATANEIFGYGEWGYSVLDRGFQQIAAIEGEVTGGYYFALIRLTVRDCLPVEEEGFASIQGKDLGKDYEHDKARKAAITDALKRAFRVYGNQFGLPLYDKEYVAEQRSPATSTAQRPAPAPKAPTAAKKTAQQQFEDFYQGMEKATTVKALDAVKTAAIAAKLPEEVLNPLKAHYQDRKGIIEHFEATKSAR